LGSPGVFSFPIVAVVSIVAKPCATFFRSGLPHAG
jgi:hypothetical protein